ncbi:MAG: MmgE/PrpD family protein [Alphaproteobacteria bacterium]|nr:MmgE/PrpD family protein [Alphaproteobacteria bacterium]
MASGARQSVTQQLAVEMANTAAEDIPEPALAAIKRLFIDHLGIAYMGAAFVGKPLHDYAVALGGAPEARLIGSGVSVPAELAAAINSQMCRATDFEETGPGTHIGPLCVHTALAVGQREHASGAEVLTAAALGYLLCARFHFSRLKGWPRTSATQHRVTAAAITARLKGFDAASLARALSLAWELPPRTHQPSAPFGKKRISPIASISGLGAPLFNARLGVQAAVLVGHGFESVLDEIDQHLSDYDVDVLLSQPPPYHWIDGEMELKPWVSSRHCQCGLQALDNLIRRLRIDAAAVSAIRLHLSNMYTARQGWLFEPAPDNYWEAIYSTQWAAAMILQKIPAGPKWVTPERLADPLSRRLAAMVEIIEDPAASRAYWGTDGVSLAAARGQHGANWLDIAGTVEVEIDGQVYSERCTMRETFGSPGMDLTESMVEGKFLEATAPVLPRDRARALLALARSVEDIVDISTLAAAM